MPVGFAILRLPFLVLDNILKVMDPMEQLALCKSSKKFESRIRGLFKNPTFNIKCNDQDRTITFGHGDKKSVFNIGIREGGGGWKVYNGEHDATTVYYTDVDSAYTAVCNDLTKTFDVQSVVAVHSFFTRTQVTDPFHFWITEMQNWEKTVTRSRCRHQSEEIWKKLATSIPSVNHKFLQFMNKNADWMSLDDAMLSFETIHLTDIKVTNEEMNRFLKKWSRLENVNLRHFHLEVHPDSRSQLNTFAMVCGLDAVETEAALWPVVEIVKPDGRKARFSFDPTTSALLLYVRF